MIVMFAVLVPIFLAMLAFVIDVGQMYLENRNAQQLADSVARTVDKILSRGTSSGGVLIAESDIPSSAKPYLSYEELKTAYPDAADTLMDLKDALDVFSTTNITITQQYGVDTDKNLYCLITVAKSYKTIMKIASAADGDTSSGASTATGSLVLKFDKADNKVTGAVPASLDAILPKSNASTQSIVENILADGHYPATMQEYSALLRYEESDAQLTEAEWVAAKSTVASSTISDGSQYQNGDNILCPTATLWLSAYVPKLTAQAEPFYVKISDEIDNYRDEIAIKCSVSFQIDESTARPYVIYYNGTKSLTINLNGAKFYGIIYAPNSSSVTVMGSSGGTASGNVFNGALITDGNISIDGSVTYNNSYNDFGLDTSGA